MHLLDPTRIVIHLSSLSILKREVALIKLVEKSEILKSVRFEPAIFRKTLANYSAEEQYQRFSVTWPAIMFRYFLTGKGKAKISHLAYHFIGNNLNNNDSTQTPQKIFFTTYSLY